MRHNNNTCDLIGQEPREQEDNFRLSDRLVKTTKAIPSMYIVQMKEKAATKIIQGKVAFYNGLMTTNKRNVLKKKHRWNINLIFDG